MASDPVVSTKPRRATMAAAFALAAAFVTAGVACSGGDHPGQIRLASGDPDAYAGASAADDAPMLEAGAQPDFGPIPEVLRVDGPSLVPPPATGAPASCTADALAISGAALRPSSAMPPAFVAAWTVEAQKAPRGVLLARFTGFASRSAISLSLGTPDPTRAGEFYAGLTPAAAGAYVDATSGAFATRADAPLALVFGDPTSANTAAIVASTWAVRGTLGAACDGASGVAITLTIPASQGSKALAEAPLSSLLGVPDTTTGGAGAGPAWTVTLIGEMPAVGAAGAAVTTGTPGVVDAQSGAGG
jgi:hypothetical protein